MKTVAVLSPEHEAIEGQWSEFFEKYQSQMPLNATSLTLGAVFLTFLEMYNPSVEEIGPVMMATLVSYAERQKPEHEGYMN
jgi:hypothetical protein